MLIQSNPYLEKNCNRLRCADSPLYLIKLAQISICSITGYEISLTEDFAIDIFYKEGDIIYIRALYYPSEEWINKALDELIYFLPDRLLPKKIRL